MQGTPNRGAHGRAVPGRGVPARGGNPRGAPGHGNPPGGQVPQTAPGRNLQGNPPPQNPVSRNSLNPGGPGGPGGPEGPGGPRPPGPGGPPMGGLPAGRGRGADPAVVAILNRLVQEQEKQASDKKDTKQFTQFLSDKFDGTELKKSLDHWNLFMEYWNYILCNGYVPGQNDPNYFSMFREQFVLTLSGITYSWFKQIIPAYHDIEDIKAAFLRRFNEWGQTVKQHMTAWNNLKFDLNKHDMDVFMHQLQWLASILYITEDQTLKKFKDTFDMNIATHLIECATLDEARKKAEQFIYLQKQQSYISLYHVNSCATT